MSGIDRIQTGNQSSVSAQRATSNKGSESTEPKGDTADQLAKELNDIRNYIKDLREQLFGNDNNNLSPYTNNNNKNSWMA